MTDLYRLLSDLQSEEHDTKANLLNFKPRIFYDCRQRGLSFAWHTKTHTWFFRGDANCVQCSVVLILPRSSAALETAVVIIRVCDALRARDSSRATCYGLDLPGIETRWWRDIPHSLRPDLGPTQHPIQWVSGVFPVGKAAGPRR